MNKIKYKLNKEWLNELLKHKTDSNVYFSLSDNDIRILLTYIDVLQSKIDKVNELIKRKLSTETYQHLKKLYDDIDSTEEIWEDYEFEDLLDILKEDK